MFNYYYNILKTLTKQDLKYKNLYECFNKKIIINYFFNLIYKMNLFYLYLILENDDDKRETIFININLLETECKNLELKMNKKMKYINEYFLNRIKQLDKLNIEINKNDIYNMKLKIYNEVLNCFKMNFIFN